MPGVSANRRRVVLQAVFRVCWDVNFLEPGRPCHRTVGYLIPNCSGRIIRRGCSDCLNPVDILPTIVATVLVSIRTRHFEAVF